MRAWTSSSWGPVPDPLADSPVIQRASDRALRAGTRLVDVWRRCGIPRAATCPCCSSYFNPLLRYGLDALARDAIAAGADGVLVTDLPPEEADGWIEVARRAALDTVFLAAPTSPDERLRKVAAASRGFVYAVSRTGVTGERDAISGEALPLVRRIQALTKEPVVLGFGLSTPEQVKAAAEVADGVVVGSALVRFLEEHPHGDVAGQVRWLKGAM